MRKNKKHYRDRKHSRTSPKGTPTPKKMSWKKFCEWARKCVADQETVEELPFGYSVRQYMRAAKIETRLMSIQLAKHNKNRTFVRRPVEN